MFGREVIVLGILHRDCYPLGDSRSLGILASQFALLRTQRQPRHLGTIFSRQKCAGPPVTATYIQHLCARVQGQQACAMLQQANLRGLGAIAFLQKQSMMDVISPEGLVDVRQGIVMIANFRSRSHHPPQIPNRAGENAEILMSGGFPVTTSAITFAVIGASKMPSRKWPDAMKYPGVLVAPKIG